MEIDDDNFRTLDDQSMDEAYDISDDEMLQSLDTNASPTKRTISQEEHSSLDMSLSMSMSLDVDAMHPFQSAKLDVSESMTSEPPEIPGSPLKQDKVNDLPSPMSSTMLESAVEEEVVSEAKPSAHAEILKFHSDEEEEIRDSKRFEELEIEDPHDYQSSTSSNEENEYEMDELLAQSKMQYERSPPQIFAPVANSTDPPEGTKEEEEKKDEEEEEEDLLVSPDIRELFKYIDRYVPLAIDLESELRGFLPEYCPALGPVFDSLQIHRPDHQKETLGYDQLDEPSIEQTNVAGLELQLIHKSRQTKPRSTIVRSISNAEKSPDAIDKWIEQVRQVNLEKPADFVQYRHPMPALDELLQAWPEMIEKAFDEMPLASLVNLSLEEMAKSVCILADIPVHSRSQIASLHLLFESYLEFKNNVHFHRRNS